MLMCSASRNKRGQPRRKDAPGLLRTERQEFINLECMHPIWSHECYGPPVDIPDSVLAADKALYSLLQRVAFSRHLNPSNGREAREAFEAGSHTPPFSYVPLEDADGMRRALDEAEPRRDHPAGRLVGQCVDGVRRLVDALDHRTPEAFDAMNKAAGWYPSAELLAQRFVPARPTEPLTVRAEQLIEYFECAFISRAMHDWTIERDEVMSARVLVDSAKRVVRVNPKAHFRDSDLVRLVVHEIDVHARRATNGEAQPLRCFVTGLPGSLATEEGLAMLAEETSGTASPGVLARQSHVVWAIDQARNLGFRELYEALCERVSKGLAWGICQRVKRGLADPGRPGVYAKDSVYLAGRMSVKHWLASGGDIAHLYVGKVGIDDPVGEWLDQGWVTQQPVPALWTT